MSDGTAGPRAHSQYQTWPSLKEIWMRLAYVTVATILSRTKLQRSQIKLFPRVAVVSLPRKKSLRRKEGKSRWGSWTAKKNKVRQNDRLVIFYRFCWNKAVTTRCFITATVNKLIWFLNFQLAARSVRRSCITENSKTWKLRRLHN